MPAKTLKVSNPFDLTEFHAQLQENFRRVEEDPEYLESITQEREGNPITLGPRVMDPTEWANDMIAGAQAKAKKWLDHSVRPRKDPKERALKAAGKYENNMRAALDGKHWNTGIAAYDEALREETIKAVGEGGYRDGIAKKKAKIAAKIAKLQPKVAALSATLDAMPVDTPEQRAAKMIAARDGMLAIKTQMRK